MAYLSDYGTEETACKSLLSLAILAVAADLHKYPGYIAILPKHLKTRLLSLATKRGSLGFATLAALLHDDVYDLDLSELPISDDTLQMICVCHHLHKLDINPGRNQMRQISTSAFIKLFPNLPHLSVLYMRRCAGVCDAVICTLVQNCPKLSQLDIGGCSRITDASLRKLRDLQHLISLNVSFSQVSDNGILSLVEGNCGSTLTELRLDSCQGITDYAIENIVLYCSNMKVLIFHGCPVTDKCRLALENLLSKSTVKQLTWTIY